MESILARTIIAVVLVVLLTVNASGILPLASPTVITVPGSFGSLQEAVNAAPPGTTIIVDACIWSGPLTINGKSNISIVASPSLDCRPVIASSGGEPAITVYNSTSITIEGFELYSENSTPAVLAYSTSRLVLDGNLIVSGGMGVACLWGSNLSVQGSTLRALVSLLAGPGCDVTVNSSEVQSQYLIAEGIGGRITIASSNVTSGNGLFSGFFQRINMEGTTASYTGSSSVSTGSLTINGSIIVPGGIQEVRGLGRALDVFISGSRIGLNGPGGGGLRFTSPTVYLWGSNVSLSCASGCGSPGLLEFYGGRLEGAVDGLDIVWGSTTPNTSAVLVAGSVNLSLERVRVAGGNSSGVDGGGTLLEGSPLAVYPVGDSRVAVDGLSVLLLHGDMSVLSVRFPAGTNGTRVDIIVNYFSINDTSRIIIPHGNPTLLLATLPPGSERYQVNITLTNGTIIRAPYTLRLATIPAAKATAGEIYFTAYNITGAPLSDTNNIPLMGPVLDAILDTGVLPLELELHNITGLEANTLVKACYTVDTGIAPPEMRRVTWRIDSLNNDTVVNIAFWLAPSSIGKTRIADFWKMTATKTVINKYLEHSNLIPYTGTVILRNITLHAPSGLAVLMLPLERLETVNITDTIPWSGIRQGSILQSLKPVIVAATGTGQHGSQAVVENVNYTAIPARNIQESGTLLSEPWLVTSGGDNIVSLSGFNTTLVANATVDTSGYMYDAVMSGARIAYTSLAKIEKLRILYPGRGMPTYNPWTGLELESVETAIVESSWIAYPLTGVEYRGPTGKPGTLIVRNLTVLGPLTVGVEAETGGGSLVVEKLLERSLPVRTEWGTIYPAHPWGSRAGILAGANSIIVGDSELVGEGLLIYSPGVESLEVENTSIIVNGNTGWPIQVITGDLRGEHITSGRGEIIFYNASNFTVSTIKLSLGTLKSLLVLDSENFNITGVRQDPPGALWITGSVNFNLSLSYFNGTDDISGLHLYSDTLGLKGPAGYLYLNDLSHGIAVSGSTVQLYSPYPVLYSYGGRCHVSLVGNYWYGEAVDSNGDGLADTPRLINIYSKQGKTVFTRIIDWYPLAVPPDRLEVYSIIYQPVRIVEARNLQGIVEAIVYPYTPGNLTIAAIPAQGQPSYATLTVDTPLQPVLVTLKTNTTGRILLVAVLRLVDGSTYTTRILLEPGSYYRSSIPPSLPEVCGKQGTGGSTGIPVAPNQTVPAYNSSSTRTAASIASTSMGGGGTVGSSTTSLRAERFPRNGGIAGIILSLIALIFIIIILKFKKNKLMVRQSGTPHDNNKPDHDSISHTIPCRPAC